MLIGLDFDNTIVCYDNAIRVLSEQIPNIPSDISRTKIGLRNYLREENRELEWTQFQGELYGPGMSFAEPFPYVITVMNRLRSLGFDLAIISHRSKKPYAGKPYDLHSFAQSWVDTHLRSKGLFSCKSGPDNVHFLETKDQKIAMIDQINCRFFVDDLIEIFSDTNFPQHVSSILFNPNHDLLPNIPNSVALLHSWNDLPDLVLASS